MGGVSCVGGAGVGLEWEGEGRVEGWEGLVV